MWANAASWLSKFDEAVLTILDTDGYPVSVRVDPRAYDVATGELVATLPEALRADEGRANLICHYHDEKMWNIKNIAIKGRIARRDDAWVFMSTSFDPPPKLAIVSFFGAGSNSARRYLAKRGLKRPEVNWAAVKEIQRRVKA